MRVLNGAKIALGLWLLAVPGPALGQGSGGAPGSPGRYWTGARSGDPLEIALDHLRGDRLRLGLASDDLAELVVTDRYRTRRTGTTHLYLRQQVDGIDVFSADLTAVVDRDGRILTRGERLVRGLRGRVNVRGPVLSAAQAVVLAAEHLGLEPGAPALSRRIGGPAREVVFFPGGVSRDEIPVKLEYVPRPGADVRLAWNLVIRTPEGGHWWNLHVDAVSGAVLRQNDWIAQDSYRVYPRPLKNPDEGPRGLELNPADPVASPFGWHDTDGVAGAEFTDTRGNNVFAQEDEDADDLDGARPDAGAGLDFDFPFDSAVQPGNNRDAAITNLFYWNNILHDIMYHYGFDEPAGNFQVDNYGNGGAAGDPVQADALDGAGVNNANFGTPPDGFEPRMQMFRWLHPTSPALVVLSPPAIAGTDPAGGALFGGGTLGLTGDVAQAIPNDACSALTNPGAMAGKIALIDRGTCLFIDKVANAQGAGAIGAIIINHQGNATLTMAGFDPALVIPAVFIGKRDGNAIENQLGSGVSVTLVTPPHRDSDFDAGIIIHEYGHGVSNRLTGGPSNVSCLGANQSRGMGEGWSDWFSLVLTAEAGDGGDDAVPVGTYLEFQPLSGPGIRNYPYSTDLAVNPLTYADISTLNVPHGVGEVWAVSLWEMYWNLVDVYGFDPDLTEGTGGNNLALQLVITGLKMPLCDPTFLGARDAILTADLDETGAVNRCLIWSAFAKRGLGEGATDGGGSGSLSVQESFDVPPECIPDCGDGILQLGETCDDGNSNFFDGCAPSCETETIFSFFGIAAGGSIDITIDGIALGVPTLPGETAVDVAAKVAVAINADSGLAALGVIAVALGNQVATNGDVTLLAVNDPGLGSPQVPALTGVALWLLGAMILVMGTLRLRRQRDGLEVGG